MSEQNDAVNHPSHYKLFPGQEAIDIIKAALTPEEFMGYLKGNALKYRLRAGNKDDLSQDIAKAEWYRKRAFDESERLKGKPHGPFWVGPNAPRQFSRMDIVGQNGNTGEHYEQECRG